MEGGHRGAYDPDPLSQARADTQVEEKALGGTLVQGWRMGGGRGLPPRETLSLTPGSLLKLKFPPLGE